MIKLSIAFVFFFLISCNSKKSNVIIEDTFQLYKVENQVGTLILFPGFGGGGSENTKKEFNIITLATKNNFSVLLMDFDQHVFLKNSEKESLKKELEILFIKNKLITENIFIGGFSSGGNVSLLLSDYLIKTKSNLIPKGVFIVDSPVDLLQIYEVSKKNITNNDTSESLEESKWIIENFNKDFGNPSKDTKNYEINAPFTFKTLNISNLQNLKNTKIRLYTEPDIEWWKNYNGNEFRDLNAFSIQQMAKELKKQYFQNIEVIYTKNKGYRANGKKHPHSWSIVDKENLITWMLNK